VHRGYASTDHHGNDAGKEIVERISLGSSSGDNFLGVHANLLGRSQSGMTFSLRKEVIQPQVLLRLPCYDFTPIMSYTLDGYPPCGLAHRLLVQPTFVM
jgi:hypothetical protein